MARTRKTAAKVANVDTLAAGKTVAEGETFKLGEEAVAHKSVASTFTEMLTMHVLPSQVIVEDDSRGIPAHNQRDIDIDRAIDIYIHGQKQPAVVYPTGVNENEWIMVTGHTRQRAVKLLNEGFTAVDPRTGDTVKFHDPDRKLWIAVDTTKTKEDAFIDGLITNIKQSSLTPVQEALAVKRLTENYSYSLTDAARFFGYNNTNRQAKLLTVLELGSEITDRVHNGEMSLDAAFSLKGLKPEKRIKLVTSATGSDGKVDGAKLRANLRDVYSKGDEEVKSVLDPQYGYSTEVKPGEEKAEGTKTKGKAASEGDEDEGDDSPVNLKRNKADFDRFADSILGDEETDLPESAKELLKGMKRWFSGKNYGDTALKNALKTHCKAK